ncbi:uncharacterized protein LOC131649871 [Vicia villosa]|uniref:uncharacterized protein LOC131649871 n=1 Tax=Vicia villosa TaxID=3911 RepID=UPI00273BA5A3|nr:uncharacterized protein LOC131649871 [Vicia villosa]
MTGKDNTIVDRTTDRAAAAARTAETEASQLRAERHAPTDSHRKQMAEQKQGQFCAPQRRAASVSIIVEERAHVEAEPIAIIVEEVQVPIPVEEVPVEAEQVHVDVEEVLVAAEQVSVVDEVATPIDIKATTRASAEASVYTNEAFPGGPSDRSVLTRYASHLAYKERPLLKVASQGSKLKKSPLSLMPEQVSRIVYYFRLLEFSDCSLTMLDASLVSVFIKRWHSKTSSFHLPFGEMTITLDDVYSYASQLLADDVSPPPPPSGSDDQDRL